MHLTDAEALARRLMGQHRLLSKGWTFRFNRRKRALGICVYGTKRIELSAYFVHQNDEEAVRDTLLHEIAHALCNPKEGHGPKWKRTCERIGARPERLCDDAVMPQGAWRATCPGCGEVRSRHRRPMRGRKYFCTACGREKGELVFKRYVRVANSKKSAPATTGRPESGEHPPPRRREKRGSETGMLF